MYDPTITHFATIARARARERERERERERDCCRSTAGLVVGAMFAEAYIGIAMILALSVAAGIPVGFETAPMSAVFGIGLLLTVLSSAELFAGYVMYLGFGLARRTIEARQAAKLLVLVWIGNLAPLSLIAAASWLTVWRTLSGPRDWPPFVATLALFPSSLAGLVASIWPEATPRAMPIWQAFSTPRAQAIVACASIVILPVILAYVAFSYRIFRRKIGGMPVDANSGRQEDPNPTTSNFFEKSE